MTKNFPPELADGMCGTCCSRATATADNEGYSSCCNDRIEYGDEARETFAKAACDHAETRVVRVTGYDAKGNHHYAGDVVCASCDLWMGETT